MESLNIITQTIQIKRKMKRIKRLIKRVRFLNQKPKTMTLSSHFIFNTQKREKEEVFNHIRVILLCNYKNKYFLL